MDLARPRGPIVVDGKSVAESVPVNDVYKYQRRYPGGAFTPRSPATSRSSPSTQIEQSENGVLSGQDSRLFVRRLSDYFTGRQPKGGAVVLTLDAATQQAAANAPRQPQGSRRRPRPDHRRHPGAGHVAVVRPQPAGGPRRHHAQRQRPPAYRRPDQAAARPRHRADVSTGVDVQADHRGGRALVRQVHPGHPDRRARTSCSCRRARNTLSNFGGETCSASPARIARRGADHLVQHRLRQAGA